MIEWRVAPYRAEFADDMRQAFVMLPSGRMLTIFVQADDVADVVPALLQVLTNKPAEPQAPAASGQRIMTPEQREYWLTCALEHGKHHGMTGSAYFADCMLDSAVMRGVL